MPEPDEPTTARERRVLLFVATRKDADVSMRLLDQVGLRGVVCDSMAQLTREISAGAAAVLATDEIVEGDRADELLKVLATQEEWSDLPLVVLVKGGAQSQRALDLLRRLTNVTVLERPAAIRSIASAVQAAVRARLRQYEARAHIQAIRAAEAKAHEAEASTHRASRAKDDFLASLSHELRTPLTPVLLLASEAARNDRLPAAVRADFELIASNIALEAHLIDDLLDLTRITRGKLKLELTGLDVVGVLRAAIRNVQPEFEQKRLVVTTRFAAEFAWMEADPTRLQQAFWNVLKNAAKFTPAGGRVTIATRLAGDGARLVIEVSDSGIGMTPVELERAFEAFAQGDHASNTGAHRFGGLGLGLSISRSVVELHRGTITARSDGPGHGCTFAVELPVTVAAPAGAAPGETAAGGLNGPATPELGLKILLVEDHDPTRQALTRLLTSRRHRVSAAATASEARSLAGTDTFDLLITDIGLPDGDGYALLRELTPARATVGVALTGYGMDDDLERSRTAGFLAHVTKPLRGTDLDAMLGKVAAAMREPDGARPAADARVETG